MNAIPAASPSVQHMTASPDVLTLTWANNTVSEFTSIWLRDNLPAHRDPHSGQRLVDIADLPAAPRIRNTSIAGNILTVEWDAELESGTFELAWLATQSEPNFAPELTPSLWLEGNALQAQDFAWLSADRAIADLAARLDWLTRLLRQGIAFLSNVPARDTAIVDAMATVGRVFDTNYGQVFDVKSVPQPENLAYSDLGLGLHTDNPYREPVPGFQALHGMITSNEGGDSLFADGLALATHLRASDPVSFCVLTQTAVPFQYRCAGAELYAERPLIQLACDGRITAVHYNSRSIAPLRLSPPDAVRFYAAYRVFAQLLREDRFQLRYRLVDGDLVVFDNQRILHGRTSFSSARQPRHLRGCYLTRDSVYSNTALLRRQLQTGAGA